MYAAPDHADPGHGRLLRPAGLLLFAAAVLAVILAVAWQYGWHGGLAFRQSAAQARARLQSATLLLGSGQYRAAEAQLAPVLRDPRSRLYRAALLTRWHIELTEAFAHAPGAAPRRRAMRRLRSLLGQLVEAGRWPAAQWRRLAREAFAIGAYALSAKAWLAAARSDPASARQDRERAARAWAADGRSAQGGRLLLALAARSHDPVRQRTFFLQGMGWLEGDGGAVAALSAGQATLAHLPGLWRDRTIVLFMARLALAAGQPQRASRWLSAALEHRPVESRR
jgi:hypothetical protein